MKKLVLITLTALSLNAIAMHEQNNEVVYDSDNLIAQGQAQEVALAEQKAHDAYNKKRARVAGNIAGLGTGVTTGVSMAVNSFDVKPSDEMLTGYYVGSGLSIAGSAANETYGRRLPTEKQRKEVMCVIQ